MSQTHSDVWKANYYFRTAIIAARELKKMERLNIKPQNTNRKVKSMTLREWIEFYGMKASAELFNVSESTVKAWRYGYRLPSIKQAQKIIQATDGKIGYESMYGAIKDIVDQKDVSAKSI